MKQWKRILAASGVVAAGAAWIGLQQPAPSLPPPDAHSKPRGSHPLPDGLPAPVRTYLAGAVGERVPIMDTALAWGTARVRFGPAWTSLRWRAYYAPGHDFYRTLEITWFGRTLVSGYDAYVDRDGVLAFGPPLNIFETGPAISQSAALALWAEAPLMPSVLAGDRVQWEALGDAAAYLRFPFAGSSEALRVAFAEQTGRLREMTGERYRRPGEKRSWRIRYSQWQPAGGLSTPVTIPHRAVLQWADESQPYGDFLLDGVVYNVDISEKVPLHAAEQGEQPAA